MEKSLLCLFFCAAVVTQVFSQNLKDGFIIKLTGDTIKGRIQYRESKVRFKECVFLEANQKMPITFLPTDLLGYAIYGEYTFLSRRVEIGNSMVDVFAEVFVSGKATLLSMNDLYFLDINGGTFPLTEVKETVTRNGADYVRTIKKYINVFEATMRDCPAAIALINETEFYGPQLSKIVNKYNECFEGGSRSLQSSKKWVKLYAGLSGGITSSQIQGFETTSISPWVDPQQFSRDLIFYPGISFEIYSPRTTEKLRFQLDVFYQHNRLVSQLPSRTVNLKYTSINIPIAVSLSVVQTGTFRGFLEGGISIYRQSNQSFDLANVRVDVTTNGSVNFLGGVGFSIEPVSRVKFVGRVRYERGEFHYDEGSPALPKRNIVALISVLCNFSKK